MGRHRDRKGARGGGVAIRAAGQTGTPSRADPALLGQRSSVRCGPLADAIDQGSNGRLGVLAPAVP